MTQENESDLGQAASACAKAVSSLNETLTRTQERAEELDRRFWESFPYIQNDERLKQATIRREREHKDN